MEFTHDNKKYRLERGVGTNRWLLLVNKEEGPRGWRLLNTDFDPGIHDEDIIDAAKAAINEGIQ